MSWLSHQFMKSASRGTGIFSWGSSIPVYGGVVEEAGKFWDKKAREKGLGAYEEKVDKESLAYILEQADVGKSDKNGFPLLGIGLVAYFLGLF